MIASPSVCRTTCRPVSTISRSWCRTSRRFPAGATCCPPTRERIAVVPPSTARFQIASETLHCPEETSPASFGSDEVGIKILGGAAVPRSDERRGRRHRTAGNRSASATWTAARRAGWTICSSRTSSRLPARRCRSWASKSTAKRRSSSQIDSFTDAFVEILKDELEFLKDHLKEVEAIAKKLAAAGWTGAIAAAIAVAVVLAIDVFVALWAPADLIIEDAIGPTTFDLVQLTSVNFPLPVAQRARHAQEASR